MDVELAAADHPYWTSITPGNGQECKLRIWNGDDHPLQIYECDMINRNEAWRNSHLWIRIARAGHDYPIDTAATIHHINDMIAQGVTTPEEEMDQLGIFMPVIEDGYWQEHPGEFAQVEFAPHTIDLDGFTPDEAALAAEFDANQHMINLPPAFQP